MSAPARRAPAGLRPDAPTFQPLLKTATPDESRPSIEHYRRRNEIDLLVPVS